MCNWMAAHTLKLQDALRFRANKGYMGNNGKESASYYLGFRVESLQCQHFAEYPSPERLSDKVAF